MSEEQQKRIIVTSALPYVNNIPHLGTLVCIIGADVYSRYLKLRGRNAISVLGTDEHGTTAETKAIEEGLTPRQLVDKYFKIHTEIYEWFGCKFDCYGRTSSQENHQTSIEIFQGLQKSGYILEQEQEQLYCAKCDKFLADRFVEGKCPFCGFDDARGDQCDSCGKLVIPTELINPRCKVCGSKPELRKTTHLFIDLPKMLPMLSQWIDSSKHGWSANARTMTEGWLKEGLKPRAITRDLKWGIPVPGYPGKVFYSWFDAPIGYISITREKRVDWEQLWKNPETELVQFMGKDNIPFHTILFPAFCMGSGLGYTLLKRLSVNEYLNYEGGKFSKSRNTGVFGDDAMNSGIAADAYRYYLMVNRPETGDTEFSWKDFQEKINNELVANIGNLINRTLVFISRFYEGKLPDGAIDAEFAKTCDEKIVKISQRYDEISLKDALREIMALSKLGNQYFQSKAPWKSIKSEQQDAADSIFTLFDLSRKLAIISSPYIPQTAAKALEQMKIDSCTWDDLDRHVQAGHTIGTPEPLFRKLEDKELAELQAKHAGKQVTDAAFPLDLRVGQILSVLPHPDADKLLVLKVDIGREIQLVAGLKPYYKPEELVGKHIIVVSNLEHAKLRGFDSQGMLLAGDDGKNVKAIFMPNSKPGELVKPTGMDVKAKTISIDSFRKIQLKVLGGKATADSKTLASDSEEALVELADGAQIR